MKPTSGLDLLKPQLPDLLVKDDSECLTIQHPRGSIRMITMTSDSLDDVESDRPCAEGLSNRDRIGTYIGGSDGFFDVLAHPSYFLSAGNQMYL